MKDNLVPTGLLDAGTLSQWAQSVEKEIAELSASIAPLQERLEGAKEKLDLIHRLMHLAGPAISSGEVFAGQGRLHQKTSGVPAIEQRIEEILVAAAKPLHISEIRATLVQMGVPLPGRGDEANLILRLRRDTTRFVRTGRGFYGLTAWNMPVYAPPHKKKRILRGKANS